MLICKNFQLEYCLAFLLWSLSHSPQVFWFFYTNLLFSYFCFEFFLQYNVGNWFLWTFLLWIFAFLNIIWMAPCSSNNWNHRALQVAIRVISYEQKLLCGAENHSKSILRIKEINHKSATKSKHLSKIVKERKREMSVLSLYWSRLYFSWIEIYVYMPMNIHGHVYTYTCRTHISLSLKTSVINWYLYSCQQ